MHLSPRPLAVPWRGASSRHCKRSVPPTEQAAIIAQLSEERAAAARQQAAAERAVDAARGAELAAAKLLADLQAQVGPEMCRTERLP